MGYSNFKKNNISLSFHDCDFHESQKTVTGIAYKFAKIPCLGNNFFVISSKKVKINYKHDDYCADEPKFRRIANKAIKKIRNQMNDKYGFLKCKTEEDILRRLVCVLSKSKDEDAIFWINAINEKNNKHPAWYYMKVLSNYIFQQL